MNLYQEAKGVLEDSHIEALLRQFGETSLGGSYAYRTMVDRDIDFDVVLPAGEGLTLELRSKIAARFAGISSLRNLKMADIHRFPEGSAHAIDGIWFGLTLISSVTKERWNVDVWFLTPASVIEEDKELTQRLYNLSDEERATIVSLKQAALDAGAKERGSTSVKIYEAVLHKGVKTYEEFLKIV